LAVGIGVVLQRIRVVRTVVVERADLVAVRIAATAADAGTRVTDVRLGALGAVVAGSAVLLRLDDAADALFTEGVVAVRRGRVAARRRAGDAGVRHEVAGLLAVADQAVAALRVLEAARARGRRRREEGDHGDVADRRVA